MKQRSGAPFARRSSTMGGVASLPPSHLAAAPAVKLAAKFKFIINLQTAKTLKIEIST
jgi:hypothetical protein